jgi:hypothetical protein
MFAEGTYVDASGVLRDADGNDTGFAVEDDGRLISTDGTSDTGGAYIDATGQVFYGDGSPMQGVVGRIGGWPAAAGGQLQTLRQLEQYVGEEARAASFGEQSLRGALGQDSTQWTTEYDASETDSVRPGSILQGLLVDETDSPMNGTFGYVLDPHGRLWTFSIDETWVRHGEEWIDLATLENHELTLESVKAAVAAGLELKGVQSLDTHGRRAGRRRGDAQGQGWADRRDGRYERALQAPGRAPPADGRMAATERDAGR